jgi:lipoprotein-releasing system permease protein
MFEFFIARRYLKSKHKINLISIISTLSTIGIAIGVAALVIVISVFNGFGSLVTSILINFDPHVKVTATSQQAYQQLDSVRSILGDMNEVKSFQPYAEGKSILVHNSAYEILDLKGVPLQRTSDDWGIKNSIVSGKFYREDSSIDQIILGMPIALKLSCRVGDTLTVTSASSIEQAAVSLMMPRTYRFLVTGIFETNNKNYDNKIVYTSLASAQNVLGLENRVTGFEIRLHDIENSDQVKSNLREEIDRELFAVDTWYDLHKDLYDVMLIERWAAFILLALIISVATFNILGSLTMSVIEKKKDIGVLRAMGVSSRSILRIFMYEGILIGVIGTISGLALGLLICYLQIEFNFYPLDATKYIINAMPVKVKFTDLLAITGISLLLSYLASLYPAKRAVKLQVIDAIKWE